MVGTAFDSMELRPATRKPAKNHMESRKTEIDVAVFDQLIGGLADCASNPSVETEEFFKKLTQVVESILDPKWLRVIAIGPNQAPLVIHQTAGANLSLKNWLNPSSEFFGLIVSDIESQPKVKWGSLLVHLKSQSVSAVQQNVVDAIAESVSEFVRRQESQSRASTDEFEQELFRFSVNAHSSLDERAVGYHLANDIRLLLGCERVSVFGVNRRSPRLLAISSVAKMEKRSELARNMKALVARSIQLNEPVLSDQKPLDSRQAKLLKAHCNNTNLPFVFGIPVYLPGKSESRSRRSPVGFLLAESTEQVDRIKFGRGISHVGPHVATSLSNARQYSQIPFRGPMAWLGRMTSFANLSRIGVIAGLATLAILALMFIQTDHKVRIPGELRPVIERTVFAPQDGIVDKVFAGHGDSVNASDPIIQIRSPELELELDKANSDLKKLQQLKESKGIALNQITSTNADPALAAQLASEISDLDFQMATVIEKQNFFEKQKQELRVVCPIDGQVTTWEAKENLTNRPVKWGEPLIKIAKLDGDWNIVFKVPERRIGYILASQKSNPDQRLELEFFLDSNPSEKYRVPIVSIDQSAIQDREIGSVTLLRCKAPRELTIKRQGAIVSGDVDCGKKSYLFVWTREMVDSIRRRFVW